MTWDMRSNMKAKAGSQGTLFQGGSDQMTDAKWPRGYTPERLNEVKAHMQGTRANSHGNDVWTTGAERRKAIDTVARSTVPAHHMLGLQFSPGQYKLPGAVGVYDASPDSAGGKYTGKVSLLQGYAADPTVVHEIGHHVSATQGTSHSGYTNAPQRGQEEAFADNYAQEHYRPRRGETYRGVGMYNGGEVDHLRTANFFDSYHAHRDYRPVFGPTSMGVGAVKSPAPAPPGTPHPRPPLPGLEGYKKPLR